MSHFNYLRLSLSQVSRLKSKYAKLHNYLNLFIFRYYTYRFPEKVRRNLQLRFPRLLLLETVSFCNAQCTICPQHEISKELLQGEMSLDLFRKIIGECQKYPTLEKICLYRLNEPLMDKDLLKRIKYAKRILPHVKIQLSTNASLLTPKFSEELLKYVDIFWFSVFAATIKDYSEKQPGLDFGNTIANLEYFFELRRRMDVKNIAMVRIPVTNSQLIERRSFSELKKISNFWRKKGIGCTFSRFTNRAGNVSYPAGIESTYFKNSKFSGCWMHNIPLMEMDIIFNGDVVLCCEDCRREIILGNVTQQSIYEIWNSKLYNDIRDELYSNSKENKFDNLLCSRCNDPFLKIC